MSERDGNKIVADGKTITVTLAQDAQIDERQLDNFLQFILLGLGIDVGYLEPKSEDSPEPVQFEKPEVMAEPEAAI